MIYVDASEQRENSRLARLLSGDAVTASNLEELTGADVMLTTLKVPVSETLIRRHVAAGALLIQLKFGRDLTSSIGTRLHESLHRMKLTGARQNQRWLLFIGDLKRNHEGVAIVDGQDERPRRQYVAVIAAIAHWNRGGVYLQVGRDDALVETLERLEQDISEPRDAEFYPDATMMEELDDELDVPTKVTDWRQQMASLPGIGPKRATALRNAMLANGAADIFGQALIWASSPKPARRHLPKIDGWGDGTYDKVRQCVFGDKEGMNLIGTKYLVLSAELRGEDEL